MSPNQVQIILAAANQFSQVFGELKDELQSTRGKVTVLAGEFLAIGTAANMAFDAVAAAIRPAYMAVEDYTQAVIRSAAQIASFQQTGDPSENYRKAKEYAQGLVPVLEQIDAQTAAGAQDLQAMTQEMVKQRIILDGTNRAQVEGFRNLANAVSVVAEGYGNKEIQIRQEIRALLQGEVNQYSQLAQQINAMVGGGLKEKVELWKREGTVIENIGGLLRGYDAASGDIQNTWSAISSTMETIEKKVLREGFAIAFQDINAGLSGLMQGLKDSASETGDVVRASVAIILGPIEAAGNVIVGVWRAIAPVMEPILGAAKHLLGGFAVMAYVVLPIATKELRLWLEIIGDLGRGVGLVGKLFKNAFTLDRAGLEKTKQELVTWGQGLAKTWAEATNPEKWLNDDLERRWNALTQRLGKTGGETPKLDSTDEETAKQRKKAEALASFEMELTERYAGELKKRELAVDRWVLEERKKLEAAGLVKEEIEKKMVSVVAAAEKEKARIRGEYRSKEQSSALKAALSAVDVAVAQRSVEPLAAARERIRLTEQLLTSEQQHLAKIDKGKDPTAWYAQKSAIDNTQKSLASLTKTYGDLAASKVQLAGGATEEYYQLEREAEEEGTNALRNAAAQRAQSFEERARQQRKQKEDLQDYYDLEREGEAEGARLLRERGVAQEEAARKSREAILQTALAEVDLAEKLGKTDASEAIRERIRLTEELLTVQEEDLALLNKIKDPASWYAQMQAIIATKRRLEELRDVTRGFAEGAVSGLVEYAKAAGNAFSQARDFAAQTFSSMENALVQFVSTGKTSFKDLVNSILADLIRLQIRQSITGPLAQALGNVNWGSLGKGGGSGVGAGAPVDLAGGGFYHSGGVVGSEPSYTRRVSLDLFSNARRYHTGGVIGAREEPIIAQHGEAVLTPGQMRMLAPAGASANVEVHIHADRETKARTEESELPGGGKRLDVYLDELTAANISRGGRTAQAMQSVYGLSRVGR